MSAAIVSSVDAAPVLEVGEQLFDLVTLAVGLLVVRMLDLADGRWSDVRRITAFA